MSDQTAEPAEPTGWTAAASPPPGPSPSYPVDPDHSELLLELTDPAGTIVFSVPVAPPLNKNGAAPFGVQVRVMHTDGCWRILQRDPLTTY